MSSWASQTPDTPREFGRQTSQEILGPNFHSIKRSGMTPNGIQQSKEMDSEFSSSHTNQARPRRGGEGGEMESLPLLSSSKGLKDVGDDIAPPSPSHEADPSPTSAPLSQQAQDLLRQPGTRLPLNLHPHPSAPEKADQTPSYTSNISSTSSSKNITNDMFVRTPITSPVVRMYS